MRGIILAMLTFVTLAGCMGDGGGAKVAAVNLEYDGSGSGDHEEKLNCDADGQVTGSGNVEDGRLTVTVRDGEGETIFDQTYDGEINFDSESVSGNEGEWTLRAERMADDVLGDDFQGNYSFTLAC